jgi:hypothetical protein
VVEIAAAQIIMKFRDSARRLYAGVFLFTLSVYLLTANGHLQGPDQEYFYRMARALVLDQSFAVEPLGQGATTGARGVDGRFYAQYAPGLPLALAPVVGLGHALAGPIGSLASYHSSHWDRADFSARFLVSYFNAPVTAATAALLARLVVQLGYALPAGAFTAFAFAFASPAWGQARSIFAEPLQALLLLLACSLALKARPFPALLSGAAFALATLVKLTTLLALAGPLVLLARDRCAFRRHKMTLVFFVVPVLAAVALHGLYNLARFGSPLDTRYTSGGGAPLEFGNPLTALYGLLLSPGRGVFVYAPALLIVAWAWSRFWARHRNVSLAMVALAVPWLIGHALYKDWDGGWGWGPRYLLPLVPLALTPLAICWLDQRARIIALGLLALGALIQIPGATVDFMHSGATVLRSYGQRCSPCDTSFRDWYFFTPANSDIIVQARLLLSGRLDLAWLSFRDSWVTPITLGLVTALGAGGLALVYGAVKPKLGHPASGATHVRPQEAEPAPGLGEPLHRGTADGQSHRARPGPPGAEP